MVREVKKRKIVKSGKDNLLKIFFVQRGMLVGDCKRKPQGRVKRRGGGRKLPFLGDSTGGVCLGKVVAYL